MMKLKLPDFSTIIIVNKNHGQTQSLNVKTKHIKRLKHYFAAILLFIISLIAMIFFLSSQYNKDQEEKKQLVIQIEKLKGEIPVATPDQPKVNTAQTYIQAIQSKLQKINEYLAKRGLKAFSISTATANADQNPKQTEIEQYSDYNNYISRLLTSVAFTPMGYPRISSVTSIFGFRSNPFDGDKSEFHPGIDFRGQKGDAVRCTANGKIVYAGWFGGYGNCIRIAHGNSFETLYGHLSHINVKIGQSVKVGDVIGAVGSTGRTTAPHLHYEVRKDGKPINPVKFLTLNN